MMISRRRILGATAAGAAALALPRSLAPEEAFAAPLDFTETAVGADRFSSLLLPQARAALDRHAGMIAARDMVGLVDFSAPSKAARFYLVDMPAGQIVSTHLVAHGRGSDPGNRGWVERLSNRPGSNASCDGAFLTGDAYSGEHGRSRRLQGLDPQNNMAESRAIVIHAADYVSPAMANSQGRVGRSQGCFAVSRAEIGDVLELLGPGRLLYAVK
ncbi:murein L,D-transpeptidase catalytic domain family protein [Novosphingobium flavum]|uniref:Murein L,D-transpeptidase catalytic domain family protein n=1 Tax=Novosphingobium flavum TaxID=1778672 RepID=A0A7X1FPN0_9SPHN|nr:murein L,D-transpeptidase catalytic domain family protein [Novosphingobium flavum]MBC2664072.1 murein L,D-transpeptidase catalytic domain family protein [Novosphingobium flavum]